MTGSHRGATNTTIVHQDFETRFIKALLIVGLLTIIVIGFMFFLLFSGRWFTSADFSLFTLPASPPLFLPSGCSFLPLSFHSLPRSCPPQMAWESDVN